MKEQLGWCDTKLLCHIIAFLTPKHGKENLMFKLLSKIVKTTVDDTHVTAEVREAVEPLAVRFAKPLESKGVSILALRDEVEERVGPLR